MTKKNTELPIEIIYRQLKEVQNKNGSWGNNNFINALIAYCLLDVKKSRDLLDKSLAFILTQKSAHWSWNYYYRDSLEAKKCPDDLDDTVCSLIPIMFGAPKATKATIQRYVMKLLATADCGRNGPYSTWINKVWIDIDPIVNANISSLATHLGIEIPGITDFIDCNIRNGIFVSHYYHDLFIQYYFISRDYRGNEKERLTALVKNLHPASAIDAALLACALLNLHEPLENVQTLIDLISEKINSGEQITEKPLYVEKIIADTVHYAYSKAFRLAVCIEALSRYEKRIQNDKRRQNSRKNSQEDNIVRHITLQDTAGTFAE